MTASATGLIDQIEQLTVPAGQLALWALGQAGFVLKGGDTIAYIDPYLSDSVAGVGGPQRRFPPPITPEQITHAQVVFATHEHMDHLDVETLKPLLAASSGATLVTSVQGRDAAVEAGIEAARIVTPRLGETAQHAGIEYTAIPAAHYQFETSDGVSRWMGFVLRCNGVTLYHAGDTLIIPELLQALETTPIDLALLPINGRDFFREEQEVIGNLQAHEAVLLAQRLKARVLIGMHNDIFAENRIDPGLLWSAVDRYAPWQRTHMLQPGELYLYAG